MVEELEGTRAYAPRREDDESGIRANPLAAHRRALDVRAEPQAPPEVLIAQIGPRVLSRFERLDRDDHAAVLAAAAARLARGDEGPPLGWAGLRPASLPGALPSRLEVRVAHAIVCEAMPVDLRRWVAEIDADPAVIAHDLALARRRAFALSGRELQVFTAVSALDHVASGEEVGKVVLRAAVAFQMRWNTAHQNVSRAWRKICEGTALGTWCGSFRAGHRFVCGPPSLELWELASAYMDACSGRGEAPGEVDPRSAAALYEDWRQAHESHTAWFTEWKKQSSRATRRWKELVTALDTSGVSPGALHASLVQGCAALGIDRWVVPAKLAQQSWGELLAPANRPASAARAAWPAFVRESELGPKVEAAFRALDRDAALADVASVELEHAYRRLLLAAERQSAASLEARHAFRGLIEAQALRARDFAGAPEEHGGHAAVCPDGERGILVPFQPE